MTHALMHAATIAASSLQCHRSATCASAHALQMSDEKTNCGTILRARILHVWIILLKGRQKSSRRHLIAT